MDGYSEKKFSNINISPYFEIKKTSYGGRAIFAKENIPDKTNILQCESPLSYSINSSFKKECCYNCFVYYGDERSLKFKVLESDIWFCSQNCLDVFETKYQNTRLLDMFKELKSLYLLTNKNNNNKNLNIKDLDLNLGFDESIEKLSIDLKTTINEKWLQINKEWISKLDMIKKLNKQWKFLNLKEISDQEYTEARYVIQCYVNLNQNLTQEQRALFDYLQSNEYQVIEESPKDLEMQLNIFKICYVLIKNLYIDQDREIIKFDTNLFRHIMGSEYANSFGIWEIDEKLDSEDREFLGTSLFPEASYFNHSCFPNVTRTRVGEKLVFQVNKPVNKDDQLCIEYGGLVAYNSDGTPNIPFSERQAQLLDKWYFSCLCDVCLKEKDEKTSN